MAAHCGNLTEHKTTPCGKNINVSGAHAYHSAADTQSLILKFLLTYKTIYFTFLSRLFRREQLFIFSLPPAKRCSAPLLHNHWGSNSTRWQGSPRTSNNYQVDLFWQAVRCDPPHSLPEQIHIVLYITLGSSDCPAIPYRTNKYIYWNLEVSALCRTV